MLNDLSMCSIDDLLTELERRADGYMFVGSFPIDGDPNTSDTSYRIYGPVATQMGLMSIAQFFMQRDIAKMVEAMAGEGDDDDG